MWQIDQKNELKNCTSMKTILMLIILLYHSMIIYAGSGKWGPCTRAEEAPVLGYIAEWMNSFHIYAFTLISGYIFYYIKYERGGYQQYLPFLWNKVLRLLVPYGFIALIWVAPINYLLLPEESILGMFVLGRSPRQLWFLLMLFWVFVIFWLISNLINRTPWMGGIIALLLYGVGHLAPGIYCLNIGLQYLVFFYLGFVIRKCDLGNRIFYRIPCWVYLVVDVGFFVLCKLIGGYDGVAFRVLKMGSDLVLHGVGAISAYVLLQKLVQRFLQKNKLIEFFSKHSMVIYLVHQQLIYFIIGWFNGVIPPIILVLINFAVSLALSTGFSVLMHKTKVTRFLVGSK